MHGDSYFVVKANDLVSAKDLYKHIINIYKTLMSVRNVRDRTQRECLEVGLERRGY